MNISVIRYNDTGDATLSLVLIDNKFECYGLEDEERTTKVYAETRIPNGNYKIQLREYGGHHERYSEKFDFHEGMLQVMDVPKFTDILIHIGNTDEDTAGCLLVGTLPGSKETISRSTDAYKAFYKKVLAAIKTEPVNITYTQIYKPDEEV